MAVYAAESVDLAAGQREPNVMLGGEALDADATSQLLRALLDAEWNAFHCASAMIASAGS